MTNTQSERYLRTARCSESSLSVVSGSKYLSQLMNIILPMLIEVRLLAERALFRADRAVIAENRNRRKTSPVKCGTTSFVHSGVQSRQLEVEVWELDAFLGKIGDGV